MKSVIVIWGIILYSTFTLAGKTRSTSEVEFSCSTFKAKLTDDQFFSREAEIYGKLKKKDFKYTFSGRVEYYIDCPSRDRLSECWSYDRGSFENLGFNENYGKRDTHQYKNHIQFTPNLDWGPNPVGETDSFGDLQFYFPDWVSNLSKNTGSKTFMAYLMMTYMDDHDGGTVPLVCYTKSVK